jgi:hypothetical protein
MVDGDPAQPDIFVETPFEKNIIYLRIRQSNMPDDAIQIVYRIHHDFAKENPLIFGMSDGMSLSFITPR